MFFPGSESRFRKNTLSRDFTVPELFTITPAYWYPASASRLFAKILTTECQSHWESNGFWLDVFQPISDMVTKRASHVLKTKVDVSRFVVVTWVSLKPMLNCLRLNQRCHPRKNKKLLILIRLSQLCLRSLTRIAQVNPFQRPRIPRPKIIPSRTRRLLKSHARQILVSLAKKSQCWSGRSPKIEECMNWKKNWSKLFSLSTEFEADFIHFWWRFTAAKFTIRNFYNPSSQNCKPNNFLKSSSILTLMSLNSAFKHVSLLHSDNYKERPNIQNKENFKLLKK